MDVLTFETCRAVNSEIIKQVTSSWSISIQLSSVSWRVRWDLWQINRHWDRILQSSPENSYFTDLPCSFFHHSKDEQWDSNAGGCRELVLTPTNTK